MKYRGHLLLLRRQHAFTMVELLTVISIIVILMSLTVSTMMSRNPGGKRNGAISQVIGSLDEARMCAIERGTTIYFGIASADHPDATKRLSSYILFRDMTQEERDSALAENPEADTGRKVALTKWESLPQGFFFNADALADLSDAIPGQGLPGNPPTVYAVGFGSLGQVETSVSSGRLLVSVVHGILNDDTVFEPESEQGYKFDVAVYSLTGRVRLAPPSNPVAVASNP